MARLSTLEILPTIPKCLLEAFPKIPILPRSGHISKLLALYVISKLKSILQLECLVVLDSYSLKLKTPLMLSARLASIFSTARRSTLKELKRETRKFSVGASNLTLMMKLSKESFLNMVRSSYMKDEWTKCEVLPKLFASSHSKMTLLPKESAKKSGFTSVTNAVNAK